MKGNVCPADVIPGFGVMSLFGGHDSDDGGPALFGSADGSASSTDAVVMRVCKRCGAVYLPVPK